MKKGVLCLIIFVLNIFYNNCLSFKENSDKDELKIRIEFQKPSYILEKDLKLNYDNLILHCDNSKIECKVNFDFSSTFGDKYKKNDYDFLSDFGLVNLSGEENKLNPKTIIFPFGTFKINLKVVNKNDNTEYKDLSFLLINEKIDSIIDEKIEKDVLNNSLNISVQGKIGKNKVLENNKLTCIDTCSVNFDGTNSIGEFDNFFWDFGNGETYFGINPKNIKYKDFGIYNVVLKAKGKDGNDYTKSFLVEFKKSVKKLKIEKEIKSNLVNDLDFVEINKKDIQIIKGNDKLILNSNKTKDFGKYTFLFIISTLLITLFLFFRKYNLL